MWPHPITYKCYNHYAAYLSKCNVYPSTHPSSPLNEMFSLFIYKCFRLDFIACSYASSSKWSRRMLNFNLEPWENPSRVIMILKFCNFIEKSSFFLYRVLSLSTLGGLAGEPGVLGVLGVRGVNGWEGAVKGGVSVFTRV